MASRSPLGPKDRKRLIIFLAAGSFVLFAILLSESSFDLPFINPSTTQQTVFLAALSALVFVIRHPHIRPGAKPDQTFCRTPHGRTGIEVPHTSGSWEFAALLSSCHRDVLVRLWTDEPLY